MIKISTIYTILLLTFNCLYCIHSGWVDPDTLESFHTIKSKYKKDKKLYKLVFSDEFDKDGRNFKVLGILLLQYRLLLLYCLFILNCLII
jgi:hypothetical protein